MSIGIAVLEFGWLLLITSILIVCLPAVHAFWPDGGAWVWMALPSALSCTVSYYCTDLYDPRVVNDFKEFRARLPRALVLAAGFLGLYFALATSLGLSMVHLSYALMGALFAIAISVPARWTASSVLRSPPFAERILILGTGPLASRIATALSAPDRASHELAALEEGEGGLGVSTSSRLPRCPVLGSLSDLEKVIGEFRPHRIIVALTERRRRFPVQELLRHLVMNEIAVEDGVQAYERTAGKLALENLNPSFLLFSGAFKKSPLLLALQRGLSIAVSVAGLIVTAPLIAILAIIIKLDSKGPIFFRQCRAGVHGRPFDLVKFRTMRLVAPGMERSLWAADNEDRITRVGRWLRRFRLDELPQFINILRGDMNLVGPRPLPTGNAALFRERIPYFQLRELIRPGLTGWAQVRNGYANGLAEETEKMRFDLYYIKNMSLWMDFRILADTVKAVISVSGS
jgi:exopolysaccharide biosynthesis polyprenyl glycosylphosphotransferase